MKYQESPLIRGAKRPEIKGAELYKKGRLSTASNYRTNEYSQSPQSSTIMMNGAK